LNEKYHLQIPDDGNFNTLSGYLVTTAGDIPRKGEKFLLPPYQFIVESVGNTKIETVRILKTDAG
jgi:CBS domain containing-hemolysin-like protein